MYSPIYWTRKRLSFKCISLPPLYRVQRQTMKAIILMKTGWIFFVRVSYFHKDYVCHFLIWCPDDYSTSFTVFLDFIQTIRARCDFKSPNAQRSVNSWKSSPVLGTVGFTYSAVPLRRIYFLFCFFKYSWLPRLPGPLMRKFNLSLNCLNCNSF